jgi:hypothetical protein
VAYAARRGGKAFVMRDHLPVGSPRFDEVKWLTFSADGQQLAFVGVRERRSRVVLSGRAGPVFDEAGGLRFGASGQLFYLAWTRSVRPGWVVPSHTWYLVRGSRKSPPWDDIGYPRIIAGNPDVNFVLSPKGKRFAYRARKGLPWHLVVDGKVSGEYARVRIPVFGPRGKHLACRVERNRRAYLWIDGKEHGPFAWIRPPRFIDNGNRLAFTAMRGRELWWRVVVFSR